MRSSQPLNLTTAPIAARSATGRSSFLVGKLKYFRGGILSLLKTPSQTSCHFFVSTTPDGRTSQTINARDQNDGNFHQIACTGSVTQAFASLTRGAPPGFAGSSKARKQSRRSLPAS